MRGDHNRNKTHCVHGHPLDGDNVRVDRRGWRRCVECKRIEQATFKALHRRVRVGPRKEERRKWVRLDG